MAPTSGWSKNIRVKEDVEGCPYVKKTFLTFSSFGEEMEIDHVLKHIFDIWPSHQNLSPYGF